MRTLNYLILLSFLFSSCNFLKFEKEANSKFADQHFKTAIANIELFKIRYGHYPTTIDSLNYLGDWDAIAISSVSYTLLDTGYQLDILSGLVKGTPTDMKYPSDFWNGLGLKKSNILNNEKDN